MAHPRSEDKRTAILEAATEVVATLGVSAPTATISKSAGVAEGTLFTYFANKDELLNQLYLKIKIDLRDAMMSDFPADKSLIDRSRHVWDGYIGWGTANPRKRQAVRQLAVSERVTAKTRDVVGEAFGEFNEMMRECAAAGGLKNQPQSFASAVKNDIAETTMDFIVREPEQKTRYTQAGFEAFWKAVAG